MLPTIATGFGTEVPKAMAKGRDRPRHQTKRKPKEKAPKGQPMTAYEAPPSNPVEVIRPQRKPRSEPGDSE